MFSHLEYQASYKSSEDGLLEAHRFIQADNIHNSQHPGAN
jgi:hypothetical protein